MDNELIKRIRRSEGLGPAHIPLEKGSKLGKGTKGSPQEVTPYPPMEADEIHSSSGSFDQGCLANERAKEKPKP
nr:hypothetical protein CFP56_32876 [Quercus suber]